MWRATGVHKQYSSSRPILRMILARGVAKCYRGARLVLLLSKDVPAVYFHRPAKFACSDASIGQRQEAS